MAKTTKQEEDLSTKETLIKGMNVTREQLMSILRRSNTDSDQRLPVVKELYDPEDKTLISETPARMIMPKIRMRLIEAACDPTRTVSLIRVFLDAYNEEMIGFERKGRLELLGALQMLTEMGESERSVTLGR